MQWLMDCQSAFNGDPLSASEYDPPPRGWDRWGGVRDPLLLSEVETTAQPDLFYADHPRLPFHRCTTKRSFCNQTRWVKLDADFPPSGSFLQAFPHLDSMKALGYNPHVAIRIAFAGNAADMIKHHDQAA